MNQNSRTEFASRALLVSDIFNVKFKKTRFSGSTPRVVMVDAEEKESTGGGKMARESVLLVPERAAPGVANIVVGFIDVGTSAAELRSYNALLARHRQRFGDMAFDIKQEEYDAFVQQAKAFLEAEKITVNLVDAKPVDMSGPSAAAPVAAPSKGSVVPVVIGLVIGLAVLGGIAAFMVMNKGG